MVSNLKPELEYDAGTLIFHGYSQGTIGALDELVFDTRTLEWRAPAFQYRNIVYHCYIHKIKIADQARQYEKINFELVKTIVPRVHQKAALAEWIKAGRQGVVCLPTGAGKTILALMAIADVKRPTLVVVPTIDLLQQWHQLMEEFFGISIGMLGGGHKDIQAITVATYDSAYLMCEPLGNRFGFLVFDECHHLPSPQYQMIARCSISPFRLGLSATVERTDGKEELIYQLVGDLVYEGTIGEMVSKVLAPYDVVSIQVELSADEKSDYQRYRKIYTNYIRKMRIDFSYPGAWQEFIRLSARTPEGKAAMEAYRQQKNLAQASEGKVAEIWNILAHHQGDLIIIFTNDNAMAYRIGQEFFLPVITHQTRPKERKRMLAAFRQGEVDVLVTSKVLNEGVDVPEASVGVVVSGSGAVREHVQRLGRILRHKEGKRAVMYELVSKDTSETYVNKRRRMHHAYQKPTQKYH